MVPENRKNKSSNERVEQAKRNAKKSSRNLSVFFGVENSLLRFFRWVSAIVDKLFFESKNITALSLILAIVLFISINISDTNLFSSLSSSRIVSDVKVTTRYNSESFEVSAVPTSCEVILSGDAATVNNAATKNGYCLINLEGYTEGSHTVKLTTSGFGDNINAVVVPSETQVVLKRKTTAQFDLGYDFVNRNNLDSRFILSAPIFEGNISKVNIRASQDTLNSIALVKALIDVSNQNTDFTVDAPLVAYNNKGQQVNAEIVPSSVSCSVKLSSPSKTVPIKLKVTGEAPTGFALDTVSMDHQTTEIYADNVTLDSIDEVTVNLDLSSVTTEVDIMQPVIIPAGVSSSDVTMVNIQISLAEATTKEIYDVPIVYKNNDNNLGASKVDTASVTVIAYGTERNLEDISASDCTAYINLKDADGNLLEPGVYDLAITIEKNTDAFVSFSCEPNNLNITLVGQD